MFREQCSTPYGIKGWDTPPRVNFGEVWLCAQRLTASKAGTREMEMDKPSFHRKCSTPYGIKGWDTPIVATTIFVWVLNALRHQRLGHSTTVILQQDLLPHKDSCRKFGKSADRFALKHFGYLDKYFHLYRQII